MASRSWPAGAQGQRRRGPRRQAGGGSEGPRRARELEAGPAGRRVGLGPSDWGRAAPGELSGIGGWDSWEERRARGQRWGPRAEDGAGEPVLPEPWQGPRSLGAGGGERRVRLRRGGRERLTRGGRRPDLPGAGPPVVAFPFLVASLLLPLLLGGDLYSLPPPPHLPPLPPPFAAVAALALGLREL